MLPHGTTVFICVIVSFVFVNVCIKNKNENHFHFLWNQLNSTEPNLHSNKHTMSWVRL